MLFQRCEGAHSLRWRYSNEVPHGDELDGQTNQVMPSGMGPTSKFEPCIKLKFEIVKSDCIKEFKNLNETACSQKIASKAYFLAKYISIICFRKCHDTSFPMVAFIFSSEKVGESGIRLCNPRSILVRVADIL